MATTLIVETDNAAYTLSIATSHRKEEVSVFDSTRTGRNSRCTITKVTM
jgi:hypothetical protein